MSYFLTFLAGMGFAALVDFVYASFLRYRIRRMPLTLDIENREVSGSMEFAVDPSTTAVGDDQMARLRKEMGI